MRRAGLLAILAVVLAAATLVQGGGWNQNAHLTLVRALSHGTPVVDDFVLSTGDLALHDGRLYSAKAPGVALATVGPYLAFDRSGAADTVARVTGKSRDDVDLWFLSLLVGVLALGVMLVLVTRLGDEVAPGYGVAAAVTAGIATMLFPFSTVVFAHVPAATLAFAGFYVLWRHAGGGFAAFGAGVLAGLAVVFEYPLGIAVVGLGLYALAQGGVRRGVGYSAGAAVGALPALLYNWWAFGSPLHFSYGSALPVEGQQANERGLFGISWPSVETAAKLLFSGRGLVVITPVVLCSFAALVLLYKGGRRAETLLIAGLSVAFLVYNAGYDVPFGGGSPGPRFLVALLPFLAVPLALSYERWPWVTLGLAVPSAVYALGVTVTGPLQATGWGWLGDRSGATGGELARVGVLVGVAIGLTLAATRSGTRTGAGKSEAP